MILVYGTVCVDRVRQISRLPRPGGYADVLNERWMMGGEAANTANALEFWGAEYILAGNSIADDGEGDWLDQMMGDRKIDRIPLHRTACRTPVCDVYVTPDGERTMFGVGFDCIEVPIDWDSYSAPRFTWFTADPNPKALAREAYQSAAAAGMRCYLMDFLEPSDSFRPIDIWQSSTDWVGVRGNTQQNVALVKGIVDQWGCLAILSDGPNGLVAGSPDRPVRHYPPYPCESYVDSTGAGDMFRAGMLFGLQCDWPLDDCLRYASAAGCLKCQWLGATDHVPPKNDVLGFVERNAQVSAQYAQGS